MRQKYFSFLLVFSVCSAFIAGCLFSQMAILGSAHALDLYGVEEDEKMWVAFKSFLDEEEKLFSDPTFPPYGKEWELARYRRYTGWLNKYLSTGENSYQEELDAIDEIERIRRVKDQLSWSCGRQDKQYEALVANLEAALLERVASLEVIRFMNNQYSKNIRDPDVIISSGVEFEDINGRQVFPGTIYDIFEARVAELFEELGNSY